MKLYHGTSKENLESILMSGIEPRGMEKQVFLADNPDSAATFVAIRGCSDIVVIPVDLPEEFLEESFDHSSAFFKCRAFMYPKTIDVTAEMCKNLLVYSLD